MVGIKWLKLYGKPELSMYPAHYANAAKKSRTRTAGCCLRRTDAQRPPAIRATVSICVTRPTSKYRTARILFGRVNGSKRLQGWFVSAVWTCRRFPKTKGTSLLSATIHMVSKRCAPIIGTSAVTSPMHSILVTKATSEILTGVNKIRP